MSLIAARTDIDLYKCSIDRWANDDKSFIDGYVMDFLSIYFKRNLIF